MKILLPHPKGWEIDADEAKKAGLDCIDEEVLPSKFVLKRSKYTPPSKQISLLSKLFNLPIQTTTLPIIPSEAKTWLVVPKYNRIASSYNKALERALDLLEKQRPYFINWRKGELDETYLHLTSKSKLAFEKISKSYKGDYLFIPVQMGSSRLGEGARRTHLMLADNEYALGPYEITIFLLTHPQWLSTNRDMGIDSAGCEYGPFNHGYYKQILFFYNNQNCLKFGERWFRCPDRRFGPATGFLLPEQKLL